jgi:hypothetical protein
MFEQTLTLLLAGEFICSVRYPDAWRFLEDEGQRREVEAFLGKLGLVGSAAGPHPPGRGLVRGLPSRSERRSGERSAMASPRSSTTCASWSASSST